MQWVRKEKVWVNSAFPVQEYQGSSVLGQFVTRFMLRETSSQLLSLQMSLQCAMEAVEAQSSTTP